MNSGGNPEQMAFHLDVDAQMSRNEDVDKIISVVSSTEKSVATMCKESKDLTLTHQPVGEASGLLKATNLRNIS